MAQKERKTNSSGDNRQNRTILGRTICLMALFGVVAFIPLLWKLWQIQIVDGEFYEEQAIDQQTRDMLVTAKRSLGRKRSLRERRRLRPKPLL